MPFGFLRKKKSPHLIVVTLGARALACVCVCVCVCVCTCVLPRTQGSIVTEPSNQPAPKGKFWPDAAAMIIKEALVISNNLTPFNVTGTPHL